jgi:hypothetical protein
MKQLNLRAKAFYLINFMGKERRGQKRIVKRKGIEKI